METFARCDTLDSVFVYTVELIIRKILLSICPSVIRHGSQVKTCSQLSTGQDGKEVEEGGTIILKVCTYGYVVYDLTSENDQTPGKISMRYRLA